MINITVKITGSQEEIARFRKLGAKLNDFTDAFKIMGTELVNFYGVTVFKGEGSAIGQKWARLTPAYMKWKAKHYPNKSILIAKGTMQKSFRATPSKNQLVIDNTDPIFTYHQLGTRKMVARPMVAVNTPVKNIIQTVIQADVKRKLAAA